MKPGTNSKSHPQKTPPPFDSALSSLQPVPPEITRESLLFLYQAATQLSSSLDYTETLNRIPRILVPDLANGCVLYLRQEDGSVIPFVAGETSELQAWLESLTSRHMAAGEDQSESVLSLISEGLQRQTHESSRFQSDIDPGSPPPLSPVDEAPTSDPLVVPLNKQEESLGFLVLYRSNPDDRFTSEERSTAMLYTEQAAQALENARRYSQAQAAYNREHSVAKTFEKSFMPHLPPRVPGLEIAHVYVPAYTQIMVGGDFYDIYRLGENHYSIVLGDVSGKGIEAAILTAMAKYNLRGLVTEFLYPQTVMSKLSGLLNGQLPPERFVSLFYGVFNVRGHQLLYANAGHEAALVEHADGGIELLEATGPILGLIPDTDYAESTVVLEPGSSLLLYTDGLTEVRRGRKLLDQSGVIDLFRSTRGQSSQRRLELLMEGAREYGQGVFRDDVAVLLVHLSETPEGIR